MVHADGVSNPGSPSLREDATQALENALDLEAGFRI